jgi:hypothetical protein
MFLPKFLGGVKGFKKNCQGGYTYFAFYCILINKFFENLPGGGVLIHTPLPPLPPPLCASMVLKRYLEIVSQDKFDPLKGLIPLSVIPLSGTHHFPLMSCQITCNFTILVICNVQWKLLNGITLGQRQIDSNKRLIPISKLGSK